LVSSFYLFPFIFILNKSMNENTYIVEADAGNFPAVVLARSREVPVVVDFWAAWCAPCQMLMPILHSLAEEYQGQFILATVDTDKEPQLAQEYGVRSLPTVKIFRHGQVVDEFMGLQPEPLIREIIERHIEKASDKLLTAALVAMDTGNREQARTLLEQARQMDPGNLEVALNLARLLIQCDAPQQAIAVLDSLSFEQREEQQVKALHALARFAQTAKEAPQIPVLEQTVAADPGDLQARHQLGARKILAEDYEGAMEQFLEIMRRDRGFEDDLGRRCLLDTFEILGNQGELVNSYRRKMASLLF